MISPGWEEAPKESDEWFCLTAQLIMLSVHFIPGEHPCPPLPINGYSCLASILNAFGRKQYREIIRKTMMSYLVGDQVKESQVNP